MISSNFKRFTKNSYNLHNSYNPYNLHTFRKKTCGFVKLINKARKACFSIQKMLNKFKEKSFAAYVKLMNSIIKPTLLYVCEC